MVAVEVHPARVELAAGETGCPDCSGVVGGWGHALARKIARLADPARPRRVRCRLHGDARVVAGHHVTAENVCGRTDLGCVDCARRLVGVSPNRRGDSGVGSYCAGLAAPGGCSVEARAGHPRWPSQSNCNGSAFFDAWLPRSARIRCSRVHSQPG
jgi:hypothetical protein